MTSRELVKMLYEKYPEDALPIYNLPKPYYKDIKSVKAILLGCDPSNMYCRSLPYAFAIESSHKIFNSLIAALKRNLKEIELNLDVVYVQNLCQNYFVKETGKNLDLWYKSANEYWIEYLKDELSVFNNNIPMLLTSEYLYNVLINDSEIRYKPIDFYKCKADIPIPPEKNKLNRPIIPFYRHLKYNLKNWEEYKTQIINNIMINSKDI